MISPGKKLLIQNLQGFQNLGLLLLFVLACPLKSASETNPEKHISDSLPNKIVYDFLSSVNSGNREMMNSFISNHYDESFLKRIPSYALINLNLSFYYETVGAGFRLIRFLPQQEKHIKTEFRNEFTGAILIFTIPVSGPKFQINGFISAELISPAENENKGSRLNDSVIMARVDQCTQKLATDEIFSGVILVAKNGRVLFEKAIGDASKSYLIPNNMDTKFNLASVGKIFTGLAVTQLVEQGKLAFDDNLSDYVSSDWLNPNVSRKIKIKHLLTHTSGLGDYFPDAYKQCTIPYFRDLQDYKPLVADDTLLFEPGTRFTYSNTGMLLLGVVLENITHEKYFDYLKGHIFEQAGMFDTDGFDKDRPVENMATGYTKMYENNKAYWNNHQYTRIMKGNPSGGIYSTARDLMKFDSAIRSNKLLSPEYSKILLEGRSELNVSFHSYGFFVSDGFSGKIASHQGDGSGVNCQFKMYLDLGYSVIVLSNYSQPSANIVANVIDQLLMYNAIK